MVNALTDREKTLAAMLFSIDLFINSKGKEHTMRAAQEFGKHLDRYLDEREKGK